MSFVCSAPLYAQILVLLERITLSGALVLIPHDRQFFRLFGALLVSGFTSVVTLLAMPYKKVMHDYLSSTTHVGLWGVLLGATCIKVHHDIRETQGTEIDAATAALGVSDIDFFLNVMLTFIVVSARLPTWDQPHSVDRGAMLPLLPLPVRSASPSRA